MSIGPHVRGMRVPSWASGTPKADKPSRVKTPMFAGGFFRARLIRRALSTVAALLAFVGGVLVLVASIALGAVLGLLGIVFGLGALLSAWWIYRGGKALLFPRARLSFAGFVAIAVGVILFVLGHGVDAMLVAGGGVLSWIATIL